MNTVAVIGAGASGVIAALKASEKNNVILIDSNDKCGKKLLLTGNGRCNYWNENINSDAYETDSKEALSVILSNKDNTPSFLDTLGIYPKIKNGYFYPYSNQASSVREIFQKKIENSKIKFETNFKVSSIKKENDKFVVKSVEGKRVICDKIIIATGSKAAPKTGSDGTGYDLAKELGHSINPVLPALSGLKAKGNFQKEWEKIRCDAKVSLYADGKFLKSDSGEIQLTSSGISGICTFNISSLCAKCICEKKKTEVVINFASNFTDDLFGWIDKRCNKMPNHTLEEIFESIFNYKLMFVFFKKAGVLRNDLWKNMSSEKKKNLCDTIEKFALEIVDTESFDKAQVCTGGIPLLEICEKTMESKKQRGIYFIGEILDADGKCGGFNLAFAFISGFIAGSNV